MIRAFKPTKIEIKYGLKFYEFFKVLYFKKLTLFIGYLFFKLGIRLPNYYLKSLRNPYDFIKYTILNEVAHWLWIIIALPFCKKISPILLFFYFLVNIYCIMLQRYNRIRILKVKKII